MWDDIDLVPGRGRPESSGAKELTELLVFLAVAFVVGILSLLT